MSNPCQSQKEVSMKSLRKSIPVVLVVVLALFAAINLQASDKKSITLYEKSQLNDVQLTPGNYKVEAVTNGDLRRTLFLQGEECGRQGSR